MKPDEMISQVLLAQRELNNAVLVIALALCYEHDEAELTTAQLIARRFTPDDIYSKSCVVELKNIGVINVKTINSVLKDRNKSHWQTFIVENPSLSASGSLFNCAVSRIKNVISNSHESKLYFRNLKLEMQACECIEYASFYASRDDLVLINPSPYDGNLQLLLMENARDQVFMLLWRAIKSHVSSIRGNEREVKFSKISQMAVKYYLWYSKSKVTIENYKWPKVLAVSKLAEAIEMIEKACHKQKEENK